MNKKPLYAALSLLVLFSSGCAYNKPAGGQPYSTAAGNTAYQVKVNRSQAMRNGTYYVSNGTVVPGTYTNGTVVNGSGISGVYNNGVYSNVTTASGYNMQNKSTVFKNNISNAVSLCDQIYNSADAGSWENCTALNNSLQTAVSNCGLTRSNTLPAAKQANLSNLMTRLSSAVASQNSYTTKKCTNAIVKQLYDMGNTYIPGSVSRVNSVKYYSREIALAKDINTAKTCNASLVKCWDGIRYSSRNTGIQKTVNEINSCISRNDLAGAQNLCKSLYNNAALSGNKSTMGL